MARRQKTRARKYAYGASAIAWSGRGLRECCLEWNEQIGQDPWSRSKSKQRYLGCQSLIITFGWKQGIIAYASSPPISSAHKLGSLGMVPKMSSGFFTNVCRMPSGPKMFSCIATSYVLPVTFSTTYPSIVNAALEYTGVVNGEYTGCSFGKPRKNSTTKSGNSKGDKVVKGLNGTYLHVNMELGHGCYHSLGVAKKKEQGA